MSDKISYVTQRGWSSWWKSSSRGFARIFIPLILLLISNSCSTPPSKPQGPVPTTLVLGLDGIPYTTFKKLQDGGHFRNFYPVAPMVASFPSISDPNWSLLMRTGPETNFTKAFFDPRIKTPNGIGQENGSIIAHLSREPRYERLMDFKVDGAWEHLSMFIWTDTTARYWLQSLQRDFFKFSGRDTYFALIVNTDILSHTEGEMHLMKYLAQIEEAIEKIQARYKEMYGKDLNVVLVSDHGNYYTAPQDIPFQAELGNFGWTIAPTISGPRDVGFYVPEMLSFGAFYCQPGSSRPLAQDFSKVDDIHAAMYMDTSGQIHVFSDKGRSEARITYNEAEKTVNYQVLKGKDPFSQAELFKKGPLNKRDYFLKTLESTYPNALVRIWEGFKKNSKIQPEVLVDPDLGYVFGNRALRLMTDLRGFSSTHGSLRREDSLGIFTSTGFQPEAVTPQEFGDHVHVKELGTAL